MARKKSDSDEVADDISSVEKYVKKTYGEGIIQSASFLLDEVERIVPVGPALNLGLSGGIPEGSWFILTGEPKTGKTTTMLHFVAKCQQEANGSRPVMYLDIEGRLKKMNVTGIKGLDIEKMKYVRSKKGLILTAEQFLDIGMHFLDDTPGGVLVVDSFSALFGEAQHAKEMNEDTMGGSAKLQSKFVDKVRQTVRVNKNIVVGTTHQTASLAKFGSAMREKTSMSLKYQADVKLAVHGKPKPYMAGTKQIGLIVTWKIETSALGPPGEVVSYIRFGQGIDEITELIQLASEVGLIDKPKESAWYAYGELKLCGLDKMYQHFVDNPADFAKLEAEVRELCQ